MNNESSNKNNKAPALPEQWIVPIKLLIYIVIAACSAYVYFNYRDLETTHFFILLPVVIVAAMVLMDCKVSERYWQSNKKGLD